MSIFKHVENYISNYINDILYNDVKSKKNSMSSEDVYLNEAYEELEEFLTNDSYRNTGKNEYAMKNTRYYPDDLLSAFSVLNVSVGAPLQECKSAYRKLIKKAHPDSSGNYTDTMRFTHIKESYERIEKWYTEKK